MRSCGQSASERNGFFTIESEVIYLFGFFDRVLDLQSFGKIDKFPQFQMEDAICYRGNGMTGITVQENLFYYILSQKGKVLCLKENQKTRELTHEFTKSFDLGTESLENSISVSKNKREIALGSLERKSIHICSQNGKLKRLLHQFDESKMPSLTWAPHSKIISGSDNGFVFVYSGRNSKMLFKTKAHENWITSIEADKKGKAFFCGDAGGFLTRVNLHKKKKSFRIRPLQNWIRCIAIHEAKKVVACGGDDRAVVLVDYFKGDVLSKITGFFSESIEKLVWVPKQSATKLIVLTDHELVFISSRLGGYPSEKTGHVRSVHGGFMNSCHPNWLMKSLLIGDEEGNLFRVELKKGSK